MREKLHREKISKGGKQLFPVIVVALLFSATLSEASPFIIKDGKPHADIVIDKTPPRAVKLASRELQHYLSKITGAKLQIVNEPGKDYPVHIYVGKSKHVDHLGIDDKKLRHGAFQIVSGQDWLVLIGRDFDFVPNKPTVMSRGQRPAAHKHWKKTTGEKWMYPDTSQFKTFSEDLDTWLGDGAGSAYAVYQFLRDLGVRWYMPGKSGEVLPHLKDIPLPRVNKTVRPDFEYRRLYFAQPDAATEDFLWFRRIGLGASKPIRIGHSLHLILHPKEIKQTHPEYYALVNGKRDFTGCKGTGRPCLSEPLFQATLKYLRAFFDTYPHETMFPVMPPDSYSYMCQGECCKEKETSERGYAGKMSDYVWGFVNKIAIEIEKTHPGKLISNCAYGTYLLPPEKIDKLNKNVVVVHCQHRSRDYSPDARKARIAVRNAWMEKLTSGEYYIWEYYLDNESKRLHGMPVIFPHLIADDLRALRTISKGEFTEGAKTRKRKMEAPGLNHLNYYVTARLYWNTEQDVDALLSEYYTKFFGPASEEMRTFYEFAEEVWMRNKMRTTGRNGFLQPDDIKRYFAFLEKAKKKAGNTVYGKRIDVIIQDCQPMKQLLPKLTARQHVPRVKALRRKTNMIILDGHLDDPLWKRIRTHRFRDLVTGGEPLVDTYFQIAWVAGDAIYLWIKCQEPDMKSLRMGTKGKDNTNIFMEDTVEFLLETQEHSYYQLAVNPAGALVDTDRAKGGLAGLDWNSGSEVAVRLGYGLWIIEMKIPLKAIEGRLPTDIYPWYFNLCRSRPREKDVDLSAFCPTGKRRFHVLDKFAELVVK